MADKKLSDVTSVEDFDYFLGVKSNGDVQKMSKDSMKKVISELMSSFLQIDSPKNFIVSNPSNMETGIISIGDASREISKSEKLNEPSEDIPFIRGMDSNGNPIYIGTEQFSSVLAGLMGVGYPSKGKTSMIRIRGCAAFRETNMSAIRKQVSWRCPAVADALDGRLGFSALVFRYCSRIKAIGKSP